MFNMSYGEMLLFGAFALLLFGAKLPEVARSFGGTYRELRKHLGEFQREFNAVQTYEPPPKRIASEADEEDQPKATSAPKFAPPPEDSPSEQDS